MRNRKSITVLIALMVLFSSLGCLALQTVTPPVEVTLLLAKTATPTLPPALVVPTPNNAITGLQSQVEAVYAAVGRAVVNIAVTSIDYDYFFNAVPQEGTGSGFVYDDQGHIITNYHVIEDAETINVTFADGVSLNADVIGADSTYDLAVLQVDPASFLNGAEYPLTPVPLGDSESLHVGQFVVAIGNPFGLDQTLTFGVISSLGRVIESPDGRYIGEAIQTDAAINPGNSGGPLLDLEGRVIGVNAQIVSPSQANAGIGFAIPAHIVNWVVPELIEYGRYRHSWMGIHFLPVGLNSQLAEEFQGLGTEVPERGVLILTVDENSPAEQAGLLGGSRMVRLQSSELAVGGDVILAVDDKQMDTPRDLIAYLESQTRVGDTILVTVWRDGEEKLFSVTLGERPQ
ncbi:MAG: trypsin-like peptidase domain-containing protein [Anaerolineae bacterium]|nr:trypsin-like peptidase domain-containing protein [Anaerolineae bacterium]